MNDLHNQLDSAMESAPEPDVADLWRRGRRAVRRRTMLAGGALAALVLIAGFAVVQLDGDDLTPADVVDTPDERGLPVVEVPEGARVRWFPVGLPDGWTTEIRPLVDVPAWSLTMVLSGDELEIRVHVVESDTEGPVRLGETFPFSDRTDLTSETTGLWGTGDLNIAWSGGGYSGVAETDGFTDDDLVAALVDAVVDSGLVADPEIDPPTGWEVTEHSGGESVGGSNIRITTPDGILGLWTFFPDEVDPPPTEGTIDRSFPVLETPIGTARVAEAGRLIAWPDLGVGLSLSWQDGSYDDALTVANALVEVTTTEVPTGEGDGPDLGSGPSLGDHWHAAYGVYMCDQFREPFDTDNDPQGLHSHRDGIIHVHPFANAVTGSGATIEAFLNAMGWTIAGDDLSTIGGIVGCVSLVEESEAETRVLRWHADRLDEPPEVFTENLADLYFGENREVWVFALVPAGTPDDEIPLPPQDRLDLLDVVTGDADPSLLDPPA